MDYKEMMDLGFKRFNETDTVFFDQNGYDWFRVEYRLDKRHYIDWDSETKECEAIHHNKKGDILYRWNLKDIDEVKNLINFFNKNMDKYGNVYSSAC